MVYIGQFTGMAVAGTELEWGDILVIIGYFVVVIAVGIAVSTHTHIYTVSVRCFLHVKSPVNVYRCISLFILSKFCLQSFYCNLYLIRIFLCGDKL